MRHASSLFVLFFIATVLLTPLPAQADDQKDDPSDNLRGSFLSLLDIPDVFDGDKGLQALRSGDLNQFKAAVSSRDQAAGTRIGVLTYLQIATALGFEDIVTYLLDLGLDPNETTGKCELTALHFAILADHPRIVEILLKHGADPNVQTFNEMNAIHLAAQTGSTNNLDAFMDRGVNVNALAFGLSPLHMACKRGNIAFARWLLDHGADLQAADPSGASPLHLAATTDDAALVQLLIDRGANLRAASRSKWTPLISAVSYESPDAARVLLKNGAVVNVVDSKGRSPIVHAAMLGNLPLMKLLASYKADLQAPDDGGNTILQHVVAADNAEAVHWCVTNGLDINAGNNAGQTPVYTAVLRNATNALLALLDLGANPSIPRSEGWAPLHLAAFTAKAEFADRLIHAGADPNAKLPGGDTPLMLAVQRSATNVITTLLAAGADVNIFNQHRVTALRVAMANTNLPIFKLLLDHGADPNATFNESWPILMDAVWRNKEDFIHTLLDHGADPNLADRSGQTALIVAIRRSPLPIITALLDAGADPARRSDTVFTAWHLAELRGQTNVAELLAARMTPEQMAPTNRVRVFFDLDAPLAQTVSVAGTFNEWNSQVNPLTRREDDGWWYGELDLFPASYRYKFVVDGRWITDPLNPNIEIDGNTKDPNSLMIATNCLVENRPIRPLSNSAKMSPVEFSYHDREAQYVGVAGEFNGWNPDHLPMNLERVGVWTATTQLAPGEYAYKLVVDGRWIPDPSNTLTKVIEHVTNSLVLVPAPHVE